MINALKENRHIASIGCVRIVEQDAFNRARSAARCKNQVANTRNRWKLMEILYIERISKDGRTTFCRHESQISSHMPS